MLPDAFDQVTGHAYVQRTVTVTGENIDAWKFCSHVRALLDSRLRGNDGCKKLPGRRLIFILNVDGSNHFNAIRPAKTVIPLPLHSHAGGNPESPSFPRRRESRANKNRFLHQTMSSLPRRRVSRKANSPRYKTPPQSIYSGFNTCPPTTYAVVGKTPTDKNRQFLTIECQLSK